MKQRLEICYMMDKKESQKREEDCMVEQGG